MPQTHVLLWQAQCSSLWHCHSWNKNNQTTVFCLCTSDKKVMLESHSGNTASLQNHSNYDRQISRMGQHHNFILLWYSQELVWTTQIPNTSNHTSSFPTTIKKVQGPMILVHTIKTRSHRFQNTSPSLSQHLPSLSKHSKTNQTNQEFCDNCTHNQHVLPSLPKHLSIAFDTPFNCQWQT